METSEKNLLYYVFAAVRIFFYPLALMYGLLIWMRNKLYSSGFFNSVQFDLPVITVGNLSTGGTGKTPHIEYLVRLFQYRYKTATMSRGYKRKTQGFILADEQSNSREIGDEPMQYKLKFPELVVSVAEERLTGIPALLQKVPDVEVILLDDAYQHRSVKAGLNILITDYAKPYYDDHILPFGNLRENKNADRRADIIIVSKCPPDLSMTTAKIIEVKINPSSNQKLFFTGIKYDEPVDFFTHEQYDLSNKNVLLVCCIASPKPLVNFLSGVAERIHSLTYRDHHYFTSADLEEIKSAYDNWRIENKVIVTTEKDAARLLLHSDTIKTWDIPLVVLPICVTFLLNGGTEFDTLALKYVEENKYSLPINT